MTSQPDNSVKYRNSVILRAISAVFGMDGIFVCFFPLKDLIFKFACYLIMFLETDLYIVNHEKKSMPNM